MFNEFTGTGYVTKVEHKEKTTTISVQLKNKTIVRCVVFENKQFLIKNIKKTSLVFVRGEYKVVTYNKNYYPQILVAIIFEIKVGGEKDGKDSVREGF